MWKRYIPTGFPEHRSDYYVKIAEGDENESNSNETFKIDKRSGTFKKTISVHKKY